MIPNLTFSIINYGIGREPLSAASRRCAEVADTAEADMAPLHATISLCAAPLNKLLQRLFGY
jgi:hypothetical protein